MSYLKHLKSLEIISKNVRKVLIVSKNYYCDSKLIKIDKNISVEKTEKKPKQQKPESLLFEYDNENCVITEREKEASITGILSKECDRLASKNKVVLRLTDGFKLTVEDSNTVPPAPSTEQPLDHTIHKLKETVSERPSNGPPNSIDTKSKKMALVRQDPGPVVFAFIPQEWITFFYPKTGVCGFYTFLFTTGTYLISKEIYVLEHNFYGGLSMALMVWGAIHYIGPKLTKWLDKEIEDYENTWKNIRAYNSEHCKEGITHERILQFQADGNLMLVDAKRENVAMQLEDEFRKRQMHVYKEVKHRLDYQVAVGTIMRRIRQRNLVQYVEAEVRKAITPDINNTLIDGSLELLVNELKKNPVLTEPELPQEPPKPKEDDKNKK